MKKGLKTVLSVLLVLMLMLSVVQISVSAAQTTPMTITASTKTALPGSSVDIDVSLKDNPGVASIGLDVAYNKNILTLEKVTYNTEFGGTTQTSPLTDNPARLLWVNPSAEFTSDAVFATLTFKISENAKDGVKSPITLTYDQNDIYNINENNVVCAVENGAVTITDVIPGDINNDKSVNNKDVTRLMQYLAHWTVEVNALALDTNGDKSVNNKDVSRLMQYLAHWDVELHPKASDFPDDPVDYCDHNLVKVEATVPTCKNEGNNAYYKCTLCGKKYSDLLATNELSDEDIAIAKLEHTLVIDPAVPPTATTAGKTEGSHCSVCGEVVVAQEVIPPPEGEAYTIIYHPYADDAYLMKIGINNPNPCYYETAKGLKLQNIKVDGYVFEGWYDGEGANGELVKTIPAGTTGDIELYAKWTPREYTIQFDCGTTNQIVEVPSKKYKVSEGATLSNPDWHGYTFLGWSDDKANLVQKIAPGTTGNITLHANWTSKRNQTVPVKSLGAPIIVEDEDEGVYLFTYEIGRIENVPLYTIKDFGHQGMGISEEITTSLSGSVSSSTADNMAESVSNATTRTSAWRLSKEWNNSTTISESHLSEIGMDSSIDLGYVKTDDEGWSIGTSFGGESSHTVETGTKDSIAGKLFGEGSMTNTTSASLSIPLKVAKLGLERGISQTLKIGAELSGSHEWTKKDTTTNSQNWNINTGYDKSSSVSENGSISQSMSSRVCDQTGYSSTRSEGGSQTESEEYVVSEQQSREYSTTVAYSEESITSETKTYKTENAREGYYRLVAAGWIRVFAVVGYDIATNAYFTTTYNVVDGDKLYEFWDYSKNTPGYDDYENGVLPFEVPTFVKDYVDDRISASHGFEIDVNTGIINKFTGTCKDVVVPDYMSVDNGAGRTVVKVTGLANGLFANKSNIETVKLGNYITSIPEDCFKNCTSLEAVECPAITSIGANAFSGCTTLNTFKLDDQITELGLNAFKDVYKITVAAGKSSVAEATILSGAKNIVLTDITKTSALSNKIVEVPAGTESFTLIGEGKTYNNLRINSKATSTTLNNLTINVSKGVPLKCISENVTLNRATINAPEFAMILTADNTNVSLYSDVSINSVSKNAVLCKNINLSLANTSVSAKMNVDDTIYICGNIQGRDLLNAKVLVIDEETFDRLSQGSVEWVLASEAPANAEIIAEKWTYDETKFATSSSSTMTGWEKYNETWKWSDWGAWSGWSTNPVTGSDTVQVETRWVPHYKTQYNYSKWSQYANGTGKNGPWQGNWGGVWCGYEIYRGWSDSPLTWNNNSQGFDMWGTPGVDPWYNQMTRQVENGGHTEYRYRTRSKVYTYYFKKTESKESNTEILPYQNSDIMVDNVQKWVKYVSKSGGTWSQ